MISLPRGINCTMLAPYDESMKVDLTTLDHMIDWYHGKGCSSIFAMCHSTEMHALTQEERLRIIGRVRKNTDRIAAGGGRRMPVLAAGTLSTKISAMASQMQATYDAGADVVVLITNLLDPENMGGGTWIKNAELLLRQLPLTIPLGLYECPMPYKRLLTLEELQWATRQKNILFMKDTCCDPEMISKRLETVRGTPLMLFNANAQTFLASLRQGAAGYSSVMSNIHPELYVWLHRHFKDCPKEAEHIQHILCFCSLVEILSYPLIAKYVMQRQGIPIKINSRTCAAEDFTAYHTHIMDQLMELTEHIKRHLPILIESQ